MIVEVEEIYETSPHFYNLPSFVAPPQLHLSVVFVLVIWVGLAVIPVCLWNSFAMHCFSLVGRVCLLFKWTMFKTFFHKLLTTQFWVFLLSIIINFEVFPSSKRFFLAIHLLEVLQKYLAIYSEVSVICWSCCLGFC